MMTTKICTKCGKEKPLEEFSPDKRGISGRQARCKLCASEASRCWRKANPEKVKRDRRRCYLRREFGLTIADYSTLLESQGGVCAICGRSPKETRKLAVDHDHETGEIRGLLCGRCNQGLGRFGDDPGKLQKAIDYLTGGEK